MNVLQKPNRTLLNISLTYIIVEKKDEYNKLCKHREKLHLKFSGKLPGIRYYFEISDKIIPENFEIVFLIKFNFSLFINNFGLNHINRLIDMYTIIFH